MDLLNNEVFHVVVLAIGALWGLFLLYCMLSDIEDARKRTETMSADLVVIKSMLENLQCSKPS